MMWLSFVAAVIFVIGLLFLPGCLQGKAVGFSAPVALACAPFLAFLEYALVGAVLGLVGIATNWLVLALVVLLPSIAAFAIAGRRKTSGCDFVLDIRCLALYVAVGLGVTTYLFVAPLDGPESFAQIFDNAFHTNLIHTFDETGRFSLLQAGLSPTLPLSPLADMAFYPAAWHVVCAMTAQALNVSVPLAINATNTAVIGVVFPVSIYALIAFIFRDRPRVPWCGALCTLAFAAFPWGFLAFGPLYSNLASYAVVPAVIFCFLWFLQSAARMERIKLLIWWALGCAAVALLQPNGIFLIAVFLLAPCALAVHVAVLAKGKTKATALAWSAGFVLIACAVWVLACCSPIFASTVQYYWDEWQAFAGLKDLVARVADLSFRNGLAQYPLAVLVLCGMIFSLIRKSYRWLFVPYAFFVVGFVLTGRAFPAPLASLFTGFWYNDIDRIAACIALAAIPFATLGLHAVACGVDAIVARAPRPLRYATLSMLYLIMAVLLYLPSFSWGADSRVETALGARIARFENLASGELALTTDEQAFVERVKEVTGDEVVINLPFDGSAFAYTTADLNVLNKQFFADEGEIYDLVRMRLDRVAQDEIVRDAVGSLGARYVLLLDVEGSSHRTLSDEFMQEEGWAGLLGIDDATPGLEVLLAEDDMRLYRVTALD